MTIIETLTSLGFEATDLGSKNGKTLVKVKTAKGWAYERLSSEAEVRQWAVDKTQ